MSQSGLVSEKKSYQNNNKIKKRETGHNFSCRKTTSTPSNLRIATSDSAYGTHKSLMDFELIKTNKDMKGDDDLGKGSYGRVKLVRDRSDKKLYALKIV